ncbi:monocarboxylate transporter 14-like [Anthonomus grandis grandis]|uniref:monocarboxylate transporter 14-like n=1 Tax=Anthonomus grandis grandis TaxID=2921223 RepID=UPI002164FA91|nr:monocarboxylate transporter 14-like [Anthonomus grandis grandis]
MSSHKENGTVPLIVITDQSENGPGSTSSLRSAYHLQIPTKETLLSSRINLYVEEAKPRIPDGGWGWLVVFGSLFINLVSDGVGSTFGILNIQFLQEFEASNSATSFIGSLFLSVPLLAGPFGSAMVDRYGCKYMTIVGSLVCTVGFFLSAFVKNIWVMYLTFGFIGGIGFCLCYVTAVVSIAFWFEKRRTLALSIAASGTGFGTVLYSPLVTYLSNEYGWRGNMLIMAGLCLNMCISGMLMKDPQWIKEEQRKTREKDQDPRQIVSKKKFEIEDMETSVMPPKDKKFSSSLMEFPTFLHEHEKVPLEVLKKLSDNKRLYKIILENYPNILSCKSASETIYFSDKSLHDLDVGNIRAPVKVCMRLKADVDGDEDENQQETRKTPLNRSDSTRSRRSSGPHHNYLQNIRFRKNSMGYRGAMLNLHKYKLRTSSCPNFFQNDELLIGEDQEEEWYDEYVEVLRDITNLSLFNELHFFLLCLATVIMCIWFVVPYFYLPIHMTSSGYSEEQACLVLSLIGFTNIIGMISFGLLGDKVQVVIIVKLFAICTIICGTSCVAMMFFTNNYALLLLFCGIFGVTFASVVVLTPPILADLVPLENFTMAYGLFLLCQGIGNLAGPPIAGLCYDLTQSYQQSFYLAGFFVILSGFLVGIIPYVENRTFFGNAPVINGKYEL